MGRSREKHTELLSSESARGHALAFASVSAIMDGFRTTSRLDDPWSVCCQMGSRVR